MSTKVTIDNLGLEASKAYARGQQALDLRLIEESRYFPAKVEGGLTPYISAEGEESFTIFTIGRATVWATFSPPQNYSVSAFHLFSYLLIPSIGGSERLQALGDKLEGLEKTIPQDRVEQYKYQTLRSFVKHLIDFSRTLESIRARCNQYQRG